MRPQFALYIGLLTNCLCIEICAGLDFRAEPPSIITGQTDNLTLLCDARMNSTLSAVTFVQLLKVDSNGDALPLVELIPGVPHPVFVDNKFALRAQAFGEMDVSKGVYLSVIFTPVSSDEGTYRCAMSFVSSDHHLGSSTVEGSVVAVDLAKIGQDLITLRQEIDDLRKCSCNKTLDGNSYEIVAFSYRVFSSTDEILMAGGVVPYSVSEFETHAVLNGSTHVITVPKTGIYSLSVTLVAGKSSSTGFQAGIIVNGVSEALMAVDKERSSSLALNLKLIKDQELQVKVPGTSHYIDHRSYLSATLLHET